MLELFFSVLASLFSIVNPIGAIPVFLAMTSHYTKEQLRKTVLHTSFYFTLILLSFFLAGTAIMGFFGISIGAMRIAGGLIILSSGYSLLIGRQAEGRTVNKEVENEALTRQDISFAPLAMPLLSGPGSISLLITLFNEHQPWSSRGIIIAVILTMGVLVYGILVSAPFFARLLGVAGMNALTRIMGFITMSIAVQYIIYGVIALAGKG